MIIYLKKDKIIYISPTDQKVLPAGHYTAIDKRYCEGVPFFYNPHPQYSGYNINKMFIIYYKRSYYGIWKDECEVPKTWKGWFNY